MNVCTKFAGVPVESPVKPTGKPRRFRVEWRGKWHYAVAVDGYRAMKTIYARLLADHAKAVKDYDEKDGFVRPEPHESLASFGSFAKVAKCQPSLRY